MLSVIVHHETLHRVLADLGLPPDAVTVTLDPADAGLLNGGFNAASNSIRLYTGHARNRYQTPTTTLIALTRTLLHELRHRWQLEEWGVEKFAVAAGSGSYEVRRAERDARQWAEANLGRYKGLVRLVRDPARRPVRRLP